MDYESVVKLFATGYACGFIISVLPFVVGVLLSLAINLMKGES